MHGAKSTLAALFFAYIAITAGCAARALPPAPISDPKSMLEQIWRGTQPDKTFRAVASIRIESPSGTYATRAALITHDPFYLRLETIPVFGTPDLLLTLNRVNLKAYFARQAKFYIAPAERGVSLVMPVTLPPSEIIPLLRGSIPLAAFSAGITVKAFLDGGLYRFDFLSGSTRVRTLWIDRATGLPEKMEIPGAAPYNIFFSGFRKIEGTSVPGVVEITSGDDTRIQIRYSETDFQSGPDEADAFDLEAPPGIEPSIME
jgi:hypothetical protein